MPHYLLLCPRSLAKTKVMVFERASSSRTVVEIRVDGVKLRQVSVFKYLGLLLTPGLQFTSHLARATERARAAASITAQLISRLNIASFKRIGSYYTCFVESQFYGYELFPHSSVDAVCSARSHFVRSVFDLPKTCSHELATILFDLPPVPVTFLRRKKKFLFSASKHEFPFVRSAVDVDLGLISSPVSWSQNIVWLLRNFDPTVSTVNLNLDLELSKAIDMVSDADFNFFFIQDGDSESLSFFRLFAEPTILSSFRDFLQKLQFPQRRLVILFSASLLRFRFCHYPREFCPLCGKRWLWDHFFIACRKLDVVPELAVDSSVLVAVSSHIAHGQWEVFLHYLRFYLLQWSDILTQAAFPIDVIDNLC